MIYEAQGYRIDLTRLTRLYPAATVAVPGEEAAQVSLEWAEMKRDVVVIADWILVFDFDPPGKVPVHRIILRYATREMLEVAMREVGALIAQGSAG